MPPFETYTIPTSRRKNMAHSTRVKEAKEFAQEITAIYEDVSERDGHVIAHYVVDKLYDPTTAMDISHAVIVAELPDSPADRKAE